MLFELVLFPILFCIGSSEGEYNAFPAPPGIDPIQHLTSLVNQMSTSMGNLTKSVQSLTHTVERNTLDIGNLTKTVQSLTHTVERNTLDIGNLTNNLQSLSQKVENLERKAMENGDIIAFSARLTHGVTLGDLQSIAFTDVITNEGNGYNNIDGEFTAPITGFYHFTASIMGHDGETIEVSLVKNGVTMASLYGGREDGDMGSHSIVVKMNTGDKVWVRNQSNAGRRLESTSTYFYCTFSGFRL